MVTEDKLRSRKSEAWLFSGFTTGSLFSPGLDLDPDLD